MPKVRLLKSNLYVNFVQILELWDIKRVSLVPVWLFLRNICLWVPLGQCVKVGNGMVCKCVGTCVQLSLPLFIGCLFSDAAPCGLQSRSIRGPGAPYRSWGWTPRPKRSVTKKVIGLAIYLAFWSTLQYKPLLKSIFVLFICNTFERVRKCVLIHKFYLYFVFQSRCWFWLEKNTPNYTKIFFY